MIHVLASGSSGNCYCIQSEKELIFVDMGITLRAIKAFFKNIDIEDKNISVLITHEHSDHTSGLKAFFNKYNATLYASAGTLDALSKLRLKVDQSDICPLSADRYYDLSSHKYSLGNFAVQPFDISHDAAEPFGYIVSTLSGNIGFLTDSGCITKEHVALISTVDTLVLEANYDEQMLQNGKYPAYLKRRIRSPKGHLSNSCATSFLARLCDTTVKQCLFVHVSEENNDYSMLDKLSNFCSINYDITTHVIKQRSYYSFNICPSAVLIDKEKVLVN